MSGVIQGPPKTAWEYPHTPHWCAASTASTAQPPLSAPHPHHTQLSALTHHIPGCSTPTKKSGMTAKITSYTPTPITVCLYLEESVELLDYCCNGCSP